MDGLAIRTTREYIWVGIPKRHLNKIEKKKLRPAKKASGKQQKMTANDVIALGQQALKDYQAGRTRAFDDFIKTELPHFAHLLPK